ncbi:hypothetical protein GALL_109320 [mine drainage metagenome]|uniref:Sulfotransferase domain protein n=1 Tax=mine drainage metagenome TaxID=410659 RepID=A0A1J5SF08_9ZZZZ
MINSDYNFLSKFLHRTMLGNADTAALSFDIEQLFFNASKKIFLEDHVFITGLARSGTTILMKCLYETDLFRSLTYADMPFVLMPNFWKKTHLSKNKRKLKERTHGDGIMVNYKSPEAFEEVFWKTFCHGDYIQSNYLNIHTVTLEIIEKFKTYVHLVLLSTTAATQKRYLSKNNNNVLRLPGLQEAFPKSTILIPFREPVQHAHSLLHQHMHFSKLQKKDPFALDYMNSLGHFEFGLGHKPFVFDATSSLEELAQFSTGSINYWLLIWKNYYKYVLQHIPENGIFIQYEDICNDPKGLFKKLNPVIDTAIIPTDDYFKLAAQRNFANIDTALLQECNQIFEALREKKL